MSSTVSSSAVESVSTAGAGDAVTRRNARLEAAGREWVSALATDARKAVVVFSAKGESFETLATRLHAGKHNFAADEPPALGGDSLGPNPVEFALGALISCQAVTYRVWAQKLGIALDGIEIRAEGDLDVRGFFGLDEKVRPGFSGVRVSVTVSGPEPESRYQELQAAVDRHCPVFDLFTNPTPVATTLEVTPAGRGSAA